MREDRRWFSFAIYMQYKRLLIYQFCRLCITCFFCCCTHWTMQIELTVQLSRISPVNQQLSRNHRSCFSCNTRYLHTLGISPPKNHACAVKIVCPRPTNLLCLFSWLQYTFCLLWVVLSHVLFILDHLIISLIILVCFFASLVYLWLFHCMCCLLLVISLFIICFYMFFYFHMHVCLFFLFHLITFFVSSTHIIVCFVYFIVYLFTSLYICLLLFTSLHVCLLSFISDCICRRMEAY